MTREEKITEFLVRCGWETALRVPILGDASFRRYERLKARAGAKAILMDAPPPSEDVRPFLAVLHILHRFGFSAPELYERDIEAGLLLLEDFGDHSFNRLIETAAESERMLYETAVDLLLALHRHVPPVHLPVDLDAADYPLAQYDASALWAEIELFTQWYLPHMGVNGDKDDFYALWAPILDELEGRECVLTLRDFHADNLFWLPDREGERRVGLIDFQDALLGHPAYDLVSLLQDARRDVSPRLEEDMLSRYIAGARAYDIIEDEDAFRRHYALLGAQRATKIIGIFARLCRRDGKHRYLSLIPRVWGLLERNLVKGDLAALEAWLDQTVPNGRRYGQAAHSR